MVFRIERLHDGERLPIQLLSRLVIRAFVFDGGKVDEVLRQVGMANRSRMNSSKCEIWWKQIVGIAALVIAGSSALGSYGRRVYSGFPM